MKLTTLHLLAELRHVVWPYGSEELDVVIAVIFCHLLCCGFVWSLKRRTKELGENGRREEDRDYSGFTVIFA